MNTGKITTHALDLRLAKPAEGLQVELWRVEDESRRRLSTAILNADGRADEPLLAGGVMLQGNYELQFQIGSYYMDKADEAVDMTPFQTVVIRFRVLDESQHYHIPLLIAPGGYSTYRGS
ncbi:hydroxyisourate hydrolase [Paenibacillus xylaniclasticus]|uniref:hydroxyisourate hydrolase n=1 Tax=Paenibacillus xylaniclasticus TaxID=588083 RepID=UPI000FDC700C|nr:MULTISPECIES: hydroxyisourate hydrolase [Paenibacillus]GFN33666.1 5-hydroxyisourate hydrolase [Paenibacillus curdlanolyticus]